MPDLQSMAHAAMAPGVCLRLRGAGIAAEVSATSFSAVSGENRTYTIEFAALR